MFTIYNMVNPTVKDVHNEGRPRKKSITKEVLLAVTDKIRSTTKTKDNDEGDEKATFWGEVCQELGIPDSKTNRTRLHHAYNHHKKMRHNTQMVTAAPASPSTDSDHTACPIGSDHSATDSDRHSQRQVNQKTFQR
ncbi:hypothetical protein KUCAC02_021249 [Chaenocephalus aceratus]|uniref:Uncharacterized protein n=1 Tax=Chaenocephalus aceratus TaxID=36190 RepID=A0ACB9XH34_CHAAC|nr:hypothetical protein KUCAC02_021249 [Chaenocephalus aceratus]